MSFSAEVKSEIAGKSLKDPKREELRCAFLRCGTISDPRKAYHLEFDVADAAEAEELRGLLLDYDIIPHKSSRKGKPLLYIKEADAIAEFLNVAGAHKSMMALENTRIEKGLRGDVNRRVNCDTANINKSLAAATRQIKDIELLMAAGRLPEEFLQLAQLRLENPEMSLVELGQLLSPPLGKSGVNHRLRRINALAAQIKDSGE